MKQAGAYVIRFQVKLPEASSGAEANPDQVRTGHAAHLALTVHGSLLVTHGHLATPPTFRNTIS